MPSKNPPGRRARARALGTETTPIRLREWGTFERTHGLPGPRDRELVIGTGRNCAIRIVDPTGRTARRHAAVLNRGGRFFLRDLGSKTGTAINGREIRDEHELSADDEITAGEVVVVVESAQSIALARFLARVIGWADDCAPDIDRAARAVRVARSHHAPLVIDAEGDAATVGLGIHRIMLGDERPFITSNPRRGDAKTTPRSFRSFASAVVAMEHARGGSVFASSDHASPDLATACTRFTRPSAAPAFFMVGANAKHWRSFYGTVITVSPLAERRAEIPRVIREYAAEAAALLNVPPTVLDETDHSTIRGHASSLREIEKITRYYSAARATSGSMTEAAKLLGVSPTALAEWLSSRGLYTAQRRSKPKSPRRKRRR